MPTVSPSIIPAHLELPVAQAIYQGNVPALQQLLEEHQLNVNSFLNNRFYDPLLVKAVVAFSPKKPVAGQAVIEYLLAQGADVNKKCKSGYNGLQVAVNQEQLMPVLELLMAYGPDVNEPDSRGANLAYWLIQGYREGGEHEELRYRLLERVLALGGNVDQPNNYGATARQWLEWRPEKLGQLVARYDVLKPPYTPATTAQPNFPTNLQHPEVARTIWKTLVPRTGRAATVQGELLRAVEKLRDEAQRNGNVNYGRMHRGLTGFLQRTLVGSALFDGPTNTAIRAAVKKLSSARQPYLEDDVYDWLTDLTCAFYLAKPELIPLPAAE